MADSTHSENILAGNSAVWGCNICLEESRNPVCTTCGHLFCWPCLYSWMRGEAKPCPVCRFSLTVDANIIPVYVATRAESRAPTAVDSTSIPPRPHPAIFSPSAPSSGIAEPLQRDLNLVQRYRETLNRVQREQAEERAHIARQEQEILQYQNIMNVEGRNLSYMRRELQQLRRKNATLTATMEGGRQASSHCQAEPMSVDRPPVADFVNAIIGRGGTRLHQND